MKKRVLFRINFFPIFFLVVFSLNNELIAKQGSVDKQFQDSLELEIDNASMLLSSAPDAFLKKAIEIEAA
ncbi:MAG: hypothetical protein NWS53_11255, partial [Salibacteraceae bacterium]|nr:hypothetical protein [Salibacteraceae bacterium]